MPADEDSRLALLAIRATPAMWPEEAMPDVRRNWSQCTDQAVKPGTMCTIDRSPKTFSETIFLLALELIL